MPRLTYQGSEEAPMHAQVGVPDYEHYLGEGGDSVDGARTFWCMYGIEGDFAC